MIDARTRWTAHLCKKLLLLVAAVVVDLLLIELGCALFGGFECEPRSYVGDHADRQHKGFERDPTIGWRMAPDAEFTWKTEGQGFPFRAGPDGFRIDDRHDAPAASASAKTIAFVGDSFTYGTGVRFADSFATLTAAKLGAVARNCGMPGFGIDQMWLTLRHEVLPRRPDLVVFAFVLDDFERSLHAWRAAEGFNKPVFKLVGDTLAQKTASDRPGPFGQFLENHSRLFSAVRGFERRFGQQHPIGDWWRVNAACLDAAIGDARDAQVPLLFLYIPTRAGWRGFPSLASHLAERGAASVDLFQLWGICPDDAYYRDDGHLNATGHARVAATLAEEIARRWPQFANGARGR